MPAAAEVVKPVLLHPPTLSSGPESGLCNQIFALVGYAVMAKRSHADLVLPNWTSHDNGGYNMAFETLFDPDRFSRSLRRIGIVTWRTPPPRQNVSAVIQPYYLSGWRVYKLMAHKFVNVSAIENAVLLGLHPAESIQRKVRAVQDSLLGNKQYGCFHARIELDMISSWKVNRAGPPPRLGQWLSSMAVVPQIASMRRILVAVGVAISKYDDAALDKPTSWNATMIRASAWKTHHRSRSKNSSIPAYIDAALVDFQLCREAQWLVGWPGSTFARALAYYHSRERGGWFSTCSNATAAMITYETNPEKWRDHMACLPASAYAGMFNHTTVTRGNIPHFGSFDFSQLDAELKKAEDEERQQMVSAGATTGT